MTPEFVITVGREAMITAFFVSAPPLIAALVTAWKMETTRPSRRSRK